jgi:hypothetical protein
MSEYITKQKKDSGESSPFLFAKNLDYDIVLKASKLEKSRSFENKVIPFSKGITLCDYWDDICYMIGDRWG